MFPSEKARPSEREKLTGSDVGRPPAGRGQRPTTIQALMAIQMTAITLSNIHSSTLASCLPFSPWNQAMTVDAADRVTANAQHTLQTKWTGRNALTP